jgi:putative hydrolases of HD superfamily
MAVTEPKTAELIEPVLELGSVALDFSRVKRITYHQDGLTPESDSDHTVMLGWLACALAEKLYPDELNLGLVAQFALVHDAPEVYAGDTPTLRIDGPGRAAKAEREQAAIDRLCGEFDESLPWFPATIMRYERQVLREARFVRGVDKLLPYLTDLLNEGAEVRHQGMNTSELLTIGNDQRLAMAEYAGEFPRILTLHCLLVDRVCALLGEQEEAQEDRLEVTVTPEQIEAAARQGYEQMFEGELPGDIETELWRNVAHAMARAFGLSVDGAK